MINIALITKPEDPSITGQSMPWKKMLQWGARLKLMHPTKYLVESKKN
jgi:hypothetical protein